MTDIEWQLRREKTRDLNCYATAVFESLLRDYKRNPHPIDVSFRTLVGSISVNDLSHSIYPYPARLLRQIPRFFLNCDQLARPGDVVLDPFCGSGTVLVEASAVQMIGWGIDKNPFARMLSRVKTTPLDEDSAIQAAERVMKRAKAVRYGVPPDVININTWFTPQVVKNLARLRRAITEVDLPSDLEQFLLVSLALTAEKCSFRDLRIPVPVRHRDWKSIAEQQGNNLVWCTFRNITKMIAKRLSTLPIQPNLVSILEGEDANQAKEIYYGSLANKVQRPKLIITSPPYGAAQKYIRSTSLALGWTGLATTSQLTALDRALIGREHFKQHELTVLHTPDPSLTREISLILSRNPLRAAIYAEYFRSMDSAMSNLIQLLSPGGTIVLVAGSNTVSGHVIETHNHLRNIAIRYGMTPILELRDTIRGRTLMTKRASTSSPLHYETIHVLYKDKEIS